MMLSESDLLPLGVVCAVGEPFAFDQGMEDHALVGTQLVVVVQAAHQNFVFFCQRHCVIRAGPDVGENGTPIGTEQNSTTQRIN